MQSPYGQLGARRVFPAAGVATISARIAAAKAELEDYNNLQLTVGDIAGNAEKMEMQHHRLMEKLGHQAQEDAGGEQTERYEVRYWHPDGRTRLLSVVRSRLRQEGADPMIVSGSLCFASQPSNCFARLGSA